MGERWCKSANMVNQKKILVNGDKYGILPEKIMNQQTNELMKV
jgi:hypothetical protein